MSQRVLKRAAENLRRKGPFLRGLLGDFDGNIAVADRLGYYYVRVERPSGYEVGVFPGRVRALYNLPVCIETHPVTNVQYVSGIDDETVAYSGVDPASVPTLDRHADTHGWEGDDMPIWLHTLQLFPLRVQPHPTAAQSVGVMPGIYYAGSAVYALHNPLVVDLSSYFPVSGLLFVSLYIDTAQAVQVLDESATTLADAPEPPSGTYWLAVVILRAATGAITWSDIVDARWFVKTGAIVNPMTSLGDIIVGAASGVPARLGIGTEGQVLTVVSGVPAWREPSGSLFFEVESMSLDGLVISLIESPVEV